MSELFAFRTASPVPRSFSAEPGGVYDPETQTSTWESGTPLLALRCTYHSVPYYRAGCNAYGSYCTTWGGSGRYSCDS
jgi:hypothetical protein